MGKCVRGPTALPPCARSDSQHADLGEYAGIHKLERADANQ